MNPIFSVFLDILLSFVYSFKSLDSELLILNSTRNKNYNFNSRFLFEYLIDENFFTDKRVYFVINDDKLRSKLNEKYPNKFISTDTIKGKLLCLKAKLWITSTIETPVYGLSKNSQRIVYHLGHGVPLKNIGLAEKNIKLTQLVNRKIRLRLFTHVTCYSSFFDDFFNQVFDNKEIIKLHFGQPRNDSLLQTKGDGEKVGEMIKGANKSVLYSPTWRPYSQTEFFPFDDFSITDFHSLLEEKNIKFFIREHPYFKGNIPDGIFESDYVINLNSDVIKDISPCLNYFDALITDYSSIYLDFLLLRKTVLYFPYDLNKYERQVGFSKPYNALKVGRDIFSYEELKNSLNNLGEDNLAEDYDDMITKLNLKSQGNCQEHLTYIKKILGN